MKKALLIVTAALLSVAVFQVYYGRNTKTVATASKVITVKVQTVTTLAKY